MYCSSGVPRKIQSSGNSCTLAHSRSVSARVSVGWHRDVWAWLGMVTMVGLGKSDLDVWIRGQHADLRKGIV